MHVAFLRLGLSVLCPHTVSRIHRMDLGPRFGIQKGSLMGRPTAMSTPRANGSEHGLHTCLWPPHKARYAIKESEPTPIPTALAVEAIAWDIWDICGEGFV
jgi:hypothetical protein